MDFCPRRATKPEAYAVPKATYTTLGPKFYACNKIAITRRPKHLQGWFLEKLNVLSHDVANADGIRRF